MSEEEIGDKELTIEDFQKAVIRDEPDRARINWKKRKWTLLRGKTTTRPKTHRPPAETYWQILKDAGRNLCVCELCNSDYRITVHHKDGNPHNNSVGNLQVLCWNCHLLFHNSTDEAEHHELEGTKQDSDPLDDRETRRFLGIVDE